MDSDLAVGGLVTSLLATPMDRVGQSERSSLPRSAYLCKVTHVKNIGLMISIDTVIWHKDDIRVVSDDFFCEKLRRHDD